MSTYFIVLLFTISVPFIKSFDSRMPFYKHWKFFFPAVGISAGFFIVWDIWFTNMGVWGFNPLHIQGWLIAGIPIEEYLFFIFIPYACIFTYETLPLYISDRWFSKHAKNISYTLIALSALFSVLYYTKAYPFATFTLLFVVLSITTWFIKPFYLGRFYLTYGIVAIPFLIVNGILTGSFIEEEVVWYNAQEIIEFRIGTIPFEDYFYGLLLMLLTVIFYEGLKSKFSSTK